jgi:iron(III) transport system ATP-binding protein
MSLSDSVVVMNAGRVEQASSPAAIYRRPANRFVADFIGRANFLDVRVSNVSGEQAEASLWDTAFRVPAHPAAANGAGVMVLRPEAIRLVAPGDAGLAGHFPGRIKSATYLGDSVEYEIAANDLVLNAVASESAWNGVFQEGDAVGWQFDPQHAYVLGPAGAAPA